jgi:uncharacterized membrane protein YphA (DoxX/SURF4 family)
MASAAIASPRQSDWSARLFLAARLLLAAIFLFAAYTKMPWKQPAALFAMTIDSYQILPPWAVMLVAKFLPWFELALGFFLLVGWPLRFATTLATLVLVGLFSVLARTYALGLEINCGCFGPGEHLDGKRLVLEGLLVALSLAVTIHAFLRHRRRSAVKALPPA